MSEDTGVTSLPTIADFLVPMKDPSYYAVIPASVRYDHKLPPNAKLLYGEITALCNKEGFCWASNEYFAKLYGVANGTISDWIKKLRDQNHITYKILEHNTRHIFLKGVSGNPEGGIRKSCRGVSGNPEHNITVNNTNNITTNYSNEFEEFWSEYPRKVAKTTAYKSWQKLNPPFDEVMAGLHAYKESDQWTRDDGKFIPHPATWLNQKRWEDEVEDNKPDVVILN